MDVKDQIRQVNRLTYELDAIYHQAAWKLGLSDSAMRIVYLIYEKGDGCLLQDICRESSLSKQTVNSALRKLEGENVLYLEPAAGKGKRIRLTDSGEGYVNRTAARLYEAERSVYQQWTGEELSRYLFLMEKYNRDLREKIEQWEGNDQ